MDHACTYPLTVSFESRPTAQAQAHTNPLDGTLPPQQANTVTTHHERSMPLKLQQHCLAIQIDVITSLLFSANAACTKHWCVMTPCICTKSRETCSLVTYRGHVEHYCSQGTVTRCYLQAAAGSRSYSHYSACSAAALLPAPSSPSSVGVLNSRSNSAILSTCLSILRAPAIPPAPTFFCTLPV